MTEREREREMCITSQLERLRVEEEKKNEAQETQRQPNWLLIPNFPTSVWFATDGRTSRLGREEECLCRWFCRVVGHSGPKPANETRLGCDCCTVVCRLSLFASSTPTTEDDADQQQQEEEEREREIVWVRDRFSHNFHSIRSDKNKSPNSCFIALQPYESQADLQHRLFLFP